ncbi:hypothetical protein AURDEDRAFT_173504 [Auricularia subglabra TFB-10046 SS5]|nr:hypothetical protein AURDEDRAFT_173504 [Auricularia subglabra TFB-10046 SS5]
MQLANAASRLLLAPAGNGAMGVVHAAEGASLPAARRSRPPVPSDACQPWGPWRRRWDALPVVAVRKSAIIGKHGRRNREGNPRLKSLNRGLALCGEASIRGSGCDTYRSRSLSSPPGRLVCPSPERATSQDCSAVDASGLKQDWQTSPSPPPPSSTADPAALPLGSRHSGGPPDRRPRCRAALIVVDIAGTVLTTRVTSNRCVINAHSMSQDRRSSGTAETLRAARAPEPNSPPESSFPRFQKLVASNVTNEGNRSRPSTALAPQGPSLNFDHTASLSPFGVLSSIVVAPQPTSRA